MNGDVFDLDILVECYVIIPQKKKTSIRGMMVFFFSKLKKENKDEGENELFLLGNCLNCARRGVNSKGFFFFFLFARFVQRSRQISLEDMCQLVYAWNRMLLLSPPSRGVDFCASQIIIIRIIMKITVTVAARE